MWQPDPKAVPALREFVGLPPEDDTPLMALYNRLKKEVTFREAYATGEDLLYNDNALHQWSPPPAEEDGLSLLLALAGMPSLRVAHSRRAVPPEITKATASDVGIWVRRWRRKTGTQPGDPLGLERGVLPWFRHHASGNLYRIGRLQFMPGTFAGLVHAFQHRQSGEVVLLAAEGTTFDPQGYPVEVEAPGAWKAQLKRDDAQVTGNVVPETGLATREARTVSLTEWEEKLEPGEAILEIHIPEDGPLDRDMCLSSLAQAKNFFAQKYPEHRFVALTCVSWLLDPAWEKRLGASSNIVQFARLGHRYPVPSGRRDGVDYVFLTSNPDAQTAPRDTELQRAMLDALSAGEPLRSGGMLILL